MKKFKSVILLLFCFFFLLSCEENKKEIPKSIDLKEIRKKGKLTILTENSSLSFLEYRDKNLGFEYEILDSFARYLGIPLEVKVVSNFYDFKKYLYSGEGDIIAANLAMTLSEQKNIGYSIPYYNSYQVLIQLKGDSVLTDASELANKEIVVRRNTTYAKRLKSLQEEIGSKIKISYAKQNLITEDLIEMVVKGKIKYTVAHENLARLSKEENPNLDISTKMSFKQKISFGLRQNCPELKKELDKFLASYCESEAYAALKHKYFDYLEEASPDLLPLGRGRISPYDQFFKREAKKAGWDWKLLAAVAYKESKFNPYAKGARGAFGLMQFMPNTGSDFGVTPYSNPETQVVAGMKLLNRIYQMWSAIPDKDQRLKFTLASYNAGPCHIFDAQKMASEQGLNPELWDNNVELMIDKLSDPDFYHAEYIECGAYRGHAVDYVMNVMRIYHSWKQ